MVSNHMECSYFFIWGILYNHENFKWFSKPLLSILANGVAGLCCFMIGWNYSGGPFILGLKYSIPYMLAFASVSMLTTIPDQLGDKQIAKRRFSVTVGRIAACNYNSNCDEGEDAFSCPHDCAATALIVCGDGFEIYYCEFGCEFQPECNA